MNANYQITSPFHDWETFPRALFPMTPVYSREVLEIPFFRKKKKFDSPFLKTDVRYYKSGRYAIYDALVDIGLKKENFVLLPSYHCLSMVAPVLLKGARPLFYNIDENLTIDISDIRSKINKQVKAIIIPHYFGFYQPNLTSAFQLCRSQDIAVIEDCAHMFFELKKHTKIGKESDFSIASCMKFFPVSEGGALIKKEKFKEQRSLYNFSPGQQIGALRQVLGKAFDYDRMNMLQLMLKWFKRTAKYTESHQPQINKTEEKILSWMNQTKTKSLPAFLNFLIWRSADIDAVCSKRRDIYKKYINAFSYLKRVKPLFDKLDNDTVPYIFPLILKNPVKDFPVLKFKGIPMLRWEELVQSNDKNAIFFSRHLIQLPCHQSLHDKEVNQIIQGVLSLK